MGLGSTPNAEMLVSRLLSGSAGRFILDADALTVLANWYAQKPNALSVAAGQTLVLTPHAGEAARLLACRSEDIQIDRAAAIRRIVERYHAVVVLKGPRTLVAAPGRDEVFACEAGNPFMALGGMGDLLAGVIGARWAYIKTDAFLAVSSAVWLHGAAGDGVVSDAIDPSVANIAARLGSMRVRLDR
jgi:NAD(P)H-hydrate epimerase